VASSSAATPVASSTAAKPVASSTAAPSTSGASISSTRSSYSSTGFNAVYSSSAGSTPGVYSSTSHISDLFSSTGGAHAGSTGGVLTGGTNVFSTGSGGADGPTAWISTNSSCPFPTLSTADLYLDVPRLTIDTVELYVEDLFAKIKVSASVGSLMLIDVGIEAGVGKLNLTLNGVEAQLRLEARLEQVVQAINRTLASIDLNPQTLVTLATIQAAQAASAAAAVIDPNLLASYHTVTGLVSVTLDSLGNVVTKTTNPNGQVISQSSLGSYTTVPGISSTGGVSVDSASGMSTQLFKYDPFGVVFRVTKNAAGEVVKTEVLQAQPTAA
jgi:hypothetical protein